MQFKTYYTYFNNVLVTKLLIFELRMKKQSVIFLIEFVENSFVVRFVENSFVARFGGH